MWSGWPAWFLGFSLFHTFTLWELGTNWAETLEFPLLLLGDSCVGARGSLSTSFLCWGTLFTWTLDTTEVVLAGTVVFTAASFRGTLFLPYSPCGVSTIYDLGVSALDLSTPWLHLWLVESCTQTGQVGRRVDFSLASASYLLKSCLDCNNALTALLLCRSLMMADRPVFICLLQRSSAVDGVLLSRGFALNSWRATWWLVSSSSPPMENSLMVWTCLSMKPWPPQYWGLLVVMVNPHLSANSLYSLLVNWVPLSQIFSSGVQSTEKQKCRAEITFLAEMLDIFCT